MSQKSNPAKRRRVEDNNDNIQRRILPADEHLVIPEDNDNDHPQEPDVPKEVWRDLAPECKVVRDLKLEFNSATHLMDGSFFGKFDQNNKFTGVVRCSGYCQDRNKPFLSSEKKSKAAINLRKDPCMFYVF
jgi:hypothetical protein